MNEALAASVSNVSGTASVATVESYAKYIGQLAEQCLRLEVQTWPKPGLVSHVDNGSHTDMDAITFSRSAEALRPFFAELAEAGAQGAAMSTLRKIGLRAERAMLQATGGINTHRGAIFGLGLLSAAAGWRNAHPGDRTSSLGEIVARYWGDDILGGPRLTTSHGETAHRRYGAGGARQEAADGFPSIYNVGLRALEAARDIASGEAEAARVHACFALIAAVEDTNLLHRGGIAGLRFARQATRAFLRRGGVGQAEWRRHAEAIHRAFVERRLSPGGAADLLAMSLFVSALGRDG
ncbi:triphosphoribosyl-dephospho-CoA synthase MdcB [Dyella sp. GSA-30]|uniref:triphosphoribosyl-dephospho-CoA synthase MdcB n=1 Tax=Dyella sp. GSA-30 TaxID=2994496 RepID=UPI00249028C3|nr:triphosphoribosyl-dephospho-CoA synthase MdcB [Dyella sp. GSA-30]BDU21419.1 putative 2-(5''-triphosphoribosyl)-3'-dephosphocoenzyme-A synthase [Dyella sp. GSA-30]